MKYKFLLSANLSDKDPMNSYLKKKIKVPACSYFQDHCPKNTQVDMNIVLLCSIQNMLCGVFYNNAA